MEGLRGVAILKEIYESKLQNKVINYQVTLPKDTRITGATAIVVYKRLVTRNLRVKVHAVLPVQKDTNLL